MCVRNILEYSRQKLFKFVYDVFLHCLSRVSQSSYKFNLNLKNRFLVLEFKKSFKEPQGDYNIKKKVYEKSRLNNPIEKKTP